VRPFFRNFEYLPTIVVLVIVLAAGSRLIYLSALHHAALARVTAADVSADYAKKIAPPLQNLFSVASRQAAGAEPAASRAGQDGKTFWMTADDQVLSAPALEAGAASGIASEWKSAEAGGALPPSAVLGPLRLGSEWLIAVRAPVLAEGTRNASTPDRWSVAYAELDELIADAHLGRLADAGYDFQLWQIEPRSATPRVFVGSSTDPLTDTVRARLALPAPAAVAGSYLELAIRPHAGWFPSGLLVSEVALLVFLAWLLGFGAHEMGHALQRARESLAASRRRVHSINQQLASEMQQRLSLQETFDHARFHDTFTGLPNRRYFMDRLDRALREVRTKRLRRVAVIIVDVSRFELINHLLGHTAGDDLMAQVARRFEGSTSAFEGTLARWGGDQFAVLLLDVESAEAAVALADKLQEQLRAPFNLRRHQLVVSATLGVACTDSGQERAEDIVREADIALSVAKVQETTKAILYAPTMGGQAANLVSLDADLHVALQKQQLRLLFQPIVDLRTSKMVGAEALLRWRHPVEGLLTPDRFLRNAEEAGLMVPITHWVIQRVIELADDWRRQLPADQKFYISVNLSPSAVRDPILGGYVADLLKDKKLPAAALKFEMTESALVGNVAATRENLSQLHDMGVQLMLDDFGTGYSSLSNLQLFPFDLVKIDCPFVDSRGVFQANMSMVAAMIQLASSLDLTPIAEIVEGEAAAASLRAMGCRYGQGYFFSAPVEAEIALQTLRSQASVAQAKAPPDTTVTSPTAKDGSQTLIMRRIQDPAAPGKATSETVIVRPLEGEGSRAVIIGTGREPAKKGAVTEETMVVRPMEETMVVRPMEETMVVRPMEETMVVRPMEETVIVHPLDETMAVRPLDETMVVRPGEKTAIPEEEDTSSTVMLPAELIGRQYRREDDDEDEDDE
jgi:diguanylate cyclase (GGDEF)-like protein